MSKGRYEESAALLKKAAEFNGRNISDKSLEALKRFSEEEKAKVALEKGNEPLLIVQVCYNIQ